MFGCAGAVRCSCVCISPLTVLTQPPRCPALFPLLIIFARVELSCKFPLRASWSWLTWSQSSDILRGLSWFYHPSAGIIISISQSLYAVVPSPLELCGWSQHTLTSRKQASHCVCVCVFVCLLISFQKHYAYINVGFPPNPLEDIPPIHFQIIWDTLLFTASSLILCLEEQYIENANPCNNLPLSSSSPCVQFACVCNAEPED